MATFSATLGVLGGLVGQFLVMLMKDWYDVRKLRRVLYMDLAALFLRVHWIMREVEPEAIPWQDKNAWQRDQLRRGLLFRGEKECVNKQELYVRLPERMDGETLYSRFHRIIDELDTGQAAVNINTDSALRIFAALVHKGSLQREYFRKVLRGESAVKFLSIINEYIEADEAFRRAHGLPD